MVFTKAVRKSVPLLISIAGTSGSGKTYSALLMAAGIAGPNGRVGFLDTENGRGSMYADSPGIVAALPNGYEIMQLDAPFSPQRYSEAIEAAEKAGINVLVVDSATHEWEGIGGCTETAETNKLKGMPNWGMAKRLHKRFVNLCLSSPMHIIFCLRARDKVKMVESVKANGQKQTDVVPIGLQPIAEKNFVYEMLVSVLLDETTHHASPLKVPEPLYGVFSAGRLITKADGEAVRKWNDSGRIEDPMAQVKKRARAAADDGTAAYLDFAKTLTPDQKRAIGKDGHEEYLRLATTADTERNTSESGDEPEQIGGEIVRVK